MEEKKKPIYLEELEESTGQKLDRYGLTKIQRKQFEKDKKLDKLKSKLPIYLWLIVGAITGVILYFCKPYLPLDETQIENINIIACIVIGICWWGIIFLIFKHKLTEKFTKIIENKKAKSTIKYELLPFTKSNASTKGSYHKDFIRCPLCGHKLEVIDSYSNGVKLYKFTDHVWKEGDRVISKSFKMIEGSDDTLEEHTSYKCTHCDFSFKASYVGKYHLNTEKPLANTEIDISTNTDYMHTIIDTNSITVLDEKIKIDKEAEDILAHYTSTKTRRIFQ